MVFGRPKSHSARSAAGTAVANLVIFRRRACNSGLASLMLNNDSWDIEFDGRRDHEIRRLRQSRLSGRSRAPHRTAPLPPPRQQSSSPHIQARRHPARKTDRRLRTHSTPPRGRGTAFRNARAGMRVLRRRRESAVTTCRREAALVGPAGIVATPAGANASSICVLSRAAPRPALPANREASFAVRGVPGEAPARRPTRWITSCRRRTSRRTAPSAHRRTWRAAPARSAHGPSGSC
jgi:hypothetical protein